MHYYTSVDMPLGGKEEGLVQVCHMSSHPFLAIMVYDRWQGCIQAFLQGGAQTGFQNSSMGNAHNMLLTLVC